MDKFPLSWFNRPGTVSISPAALAMARAFSEETSRLEPKEDWVVCFDWADSRRARKKGTNEWSDLGSGLDLVAYERNRVPAAAIALIDGLEILTKVPLKNREGRIEVDRRLRTHLALL